MLCKKPYRKGPLAYGCGQCLPCRINKRREWTSRLLLEAKEHPYAAFITLTYNDENKPRDNSVTKRHAQLFIKSLRDLIKPRKLRYFIVGEYGDQTHRPHYHAILFGISPTERPLIEKAWKKGFISIGTAETKSISYCGSYICKKWTNKAHPALQGREPEFSLMSKNPGIGANFAQRVITSYQTTRGNAALAQKGWFATQWRSEGRCRPYGRYIRNRIFDGLGLTLDQRKKHLKEEADTLAAIYAELTAEEQEYTINVKLLKQDAHLNKKTRRTL